MSILKLVVIVWVLTFVAMVALQVENQHEGGR